MTQHRTANTLITSHKRLEAPRPINIDMDNGRLTVLRKRFLVDYAPGDVQDLNERFIEILEKIRVKISTQKFDNKTTIQNSPQLNIQEYLIQLRDVGVEAYALIPEGVIDYITELEEQEQERGLSLDFTFPADMTLLWEMIYTGNPLDPVNIEKFWGFRYSIGHLSWESDLIEWIKLHKGAFTLVHSGFTSSKDELNQLEKDLNNLNHRKFGIHRLEDALSHDDLCNEKVLEYFNNIDFTYGIVHFACHCINPGTTGASRAYLNLITHQKEIQLSLGKFNVLARRKQGFKEHPFIFLNACESATPLHLLQSLNLPSVMLKFGAGGVIATACTLPDNFAGAFASKFYENLLSKPLADQPAYIGQALLETRQHFMKKYQNPLGLAYGLYAVSNQRLRVD